MKKQVSDRIAEAKELQAAINQKRIAEGTGTLAFGPFYSRMIESELYRELGYETVEYWAEAELDHHKTQVYEIARVWNALQKVFGLEGAAEMTYTNARFLVFAFGDALPKKFQTGEVLEAGHKMTGRQFEAYIRELKPDLLIERQTSKSFGLTPSQKGTVQHALNRMKKEEGMESDGEALTTMAVRVLARDCPATLLDLCYQLILKHEAVRLSIEVNRVDRPNLEQWLALDEIAKKASEAFAEMAPAIEQVVSHAG